MSHVSVQRRLRCAVLSGCRMSRHRDRNRITQHRYSTGRIDRRTASFEMAKYPSSIWITTRMVKSGGNQLEAARQTIRSLTAARELAERSLAQAETTIRDLRTKLAHERLARDEAVTRVGTERQTAEQAQTELVTERAARRQAEMRLAQVLDQQPTEAPSRGRPGRKVGRAGAAAAPSMAIDVEPEGTAEDGTIVRMTAREPIGNDVAQPTQARRRGRPPKISQPEAEFVEWWKPGWKERFR